MSRKLLATLATPVLLLAGACGDDGGSDAQVLTGDAAVAALHGAPDAVADAGSARIEMTMDFVLDGEAVTMGATGAFSGDRFQMSIDLSGMLAELGEDMPEGMGEPMEMVGEGTTIYMHMPFLDEMLGGATWLSASPEDLGVATEALGLGAGANNPAQMLETLRGVGDVEAIGQEEVRGTETTRYHVDIDLAQAFAEVPAELREQLEQTIGDVSGTLPMDVWLDGDGLPRRVSMDMGALMGALEEGAAGTMVIDYFDYGADIEIELPDPADVRSFTDVMGGFGGAQEFEAVGDAIG